MEARHELMENYRLIPDSEGKIEVFEKFWEDIHFQPTAPPILVSADLLLEGGKRNIETAQMIFHEYIEPNL